MRKGKLISLILMLLLCLPFVASAQVKRAKKKSKAVKKPAVCKTGEISFPCPKDYKILFNGNASNSVFLAQNAEYGYSVFVIAPKDKFDEQNLMTETIKSLLKTLYPKESQDYRWKDVEFFNRNSSSKFEVGKKVSNGFNGNQIVTVEYRHISFNGKNFIAGTIVDGFETGSQAEEDFNDGRYTGNGGCFDAIKIIHSFTGEKFNEELNPCRLEIKIAK